MATTFTNGPAAQVDRIFGKAEQYAKTAESGLKGFTAQLERIDYAPPINSSGFKWDDVKPPAFDPGPQKPVLPPIGFKGPSGVPTDLAEELPDIEIDKFTELAPGVNMPIAPSLSYGSVPSVPSVGVVTVPDAPLLVMPDTPGYMTINTVSFGGVDLHENWLTRLEDTPTLTLASPTPYSYVAGPEYASSLLDNLKARLLARS